MYTDEGVNYTKEVGKYKVGRREYYENIVQIEDWEGKRNTWKEWGDKSGDMNERGVRNRKGDGLGKNKGKIKDKQLEIKEYPPC